MMIYRASGDSTVSSRSVRSEYWAKQVPLEFKNRSSTSGSRMHSKISPPSDFSRRRAASALDPTLSAIQLLRHPINQRLPFLPCLGSAFLAHERQLHLCPNCGSDGADVLLDGFQTLHQHV